MALEKILFVGLLGWGIRATRKAKEEREREASNQRREAEKRRKRQNTPCDFSDGLSQDEFAQIAKKSAKRIKRIISVDVTGPIIAGTFCSQSGISIWEFTLDFNDYGHITGTYWHASDNGESNIPKALGDIIQATIKDKLSQCTKCSDEKNEDTDTNLNCEEEPILITLNEPITNTINYEPLQKKTKKKCWKRIFGLTFMAIAIIFVGYHIWESSKLTPVGFSSQSVQGESFKSIYYKLTASGFENITFNEIADLTFAEIAEENLVQNISIDGDNYFSATSKYPYDTEIIITYHTLRPIPLPVSHKEVKGENYEIVETLFLEAGFINVKAEPEYDLILGWLTNDGQVKEVIIDGEKKFSNSDTYRPDAKIVITYHALKKDKSN